VIITLGKETRKEGGNSSSNCHGQSSSTTMDSKDANTTSRKPDKNKTTRYTLLGDLEYKAPKIGV
jgi:hypothetical protein